MVKKTKGGITYINGIKADEFHKRCEERHSARGYKKPKKRGRPRKNPVNVVKQVIAPAPMKEWDLAFKDLKISKTENTSVVTPITYDCNLFPVSEEGYGYVTFEGYLTAVLQVGQEYTIGDLIRMFSAMLEVVPDSRTMLENALVRLLAWGIIQYTDGYNKFKRTPIKFTNVVSLEDIGGSWYETNLYSPEGDLLVTYNTTGEAPLYVNRDYTLRKNSKEQVTVTSKSTNESSIVLEDRPTFSENMSFGEAIKNVFTVAKRILKNSIK